jgi:hypothetical protein
MLVFIPTYDDQTRDNWSVADGILPVEVLLLFADSATRDNLLRALEQEETVFVMSHGDENAIMESSNSEAFSSADVPQFPNKQAFVYACDTVHELGESFKNNGSIYWGYNTTILSPVTEPDAKKRLFQRIFSFIIQQFTDCRSEEAIHQFLKNLKNLCDSARNELNTIEPFDLSSHAAIRDIWNRLRVKHFEYSQPFAHPEAITSEETLDI